jgi:hypothetical protein
MQQIQTTFPTAPAKAKRTPTPRTRRPVALRMAHPFAHPIPKTPTEPQSKTRPAAEPSKAA